MRGSIVAIGTLLAVASVASGQVDDHLVCYKIRDPLALVGLVDIDTPQFGNLGSCKISRAKMFCAPASKTILEARDGKHGAEIDPLPIGGTPAPGDRICYRVKCPIDRPPDEVVSDQFGTRTQSRFKVSMLCTPAIKGPPTTTSTSTTLAPPTTAASTTTMTVASTTTTGTGCSSRFPPSCGLGDFTCQVLLGDARARCTSFGGSCGCMVPTTTSMVTTSTSTSSTTSSTTSTVP